MATVSTGLASRLLDGQRFADIMFNGRIEVRTGAPPITADDAPSGTVLGYITRDGLPWTAGAPTGGLQWSPNGRYLESQPGHRWVLTGVATGVAGHFRLVGNAPDDGDLSATAPRLDGSISLAGGAPADLYVPSLDITPATSRQVDLFWITLF